MQIESTSSCLIIGEIAQAHDGSLGTAHAFIDAIADTGADAVKFQTHIADAESTPGEPWRVKFSPQDESRYEYWQRMEFTEDQWHGLKAHADDRNLIFLSSPFSIEAFELLSRIGIKAWKIASGEVSNIPLIERIVSTGQPIMLSSGMSTTAELNEVVELIQEHGNDLTLFQCTSAYPVPAEKIGLNMLAEFRQRYECKVGISDHSGTIFTGLAAATLGANAIEVHVTFSREMFGPDVSSSITTSELRQLVNGVKFIHDVISNPIEKDSIALEMQHLRDLFTKSVFARIDLPAGTILKPEHLTVKKPGTFIPAKQLKELIGCRLLIDVKANQPLSFDQLEV
jgi:N,N'-diacetyllegionaminate synthase